MREILFKDKRKDNGEWVEGFYYESLISGCYILVPKLKTRRKDGVIIGDSFDVYEVDPETVCQYTGLKDMNGKKIFEGDILKGFEYPFTDNDDNHNYYAKVIWFDNSPAFGIYTFKNPLSTVRGISTGNTEYLEDFEPKSWEVIGNVFDHKELLEETE